MVNLGIQGIIIPSINNQNQTLMKKLVVFCLAASLIACNTKDKKTETAKNSDLIQQNLKGNVKQLDELTVNIDSTGKMKPDSSTTITEFDKKGYQSKNSTKDSSGKITSEQTISHNSDGTFKEMLTTKNGKQTFKLTTDVKDGNYTGGKSYDSTGKQDSYYTDLKTNEYGIVYAGKQHFMNDKIKSTFEMKYDGPNFIGGTATDSTGKTTYTGSIKLDDKGNAAEETATTLEKGATKTEVFTYKYDSFDKTGNWTQRTTYNDKGKPTKIVKRSLVYFED